ncbi:MAG TPA: hypothetical protein VMW55_06740 [Nitrosopumilaceae archaeon]|jgi:hypothetical protein|nr:hypothetical protein [Nitrosopumilaceae archaeon]
MDREFYDIDDGPDVADEKLTYFSYNCEICNIHLDGKNKNWYDSEDVSCYLQVEQAKPYMTSEEYSRNAKNRSS